MIKKIIVFAAIVINVIPVFGQSSVFTNDTSITRKTEYKIPVYAELEKPVENLFFEINYDYFTLNIIDFQTCDSCLFENVEHSINVTEDNQNAYLDVSGELKESQSEGILGYAVVEGLYGPDSVSSFNINSVTIDDEPLEPDYYDESLITVRGESIYPAEREEISHNFPNPFYYNTTFDIFLTESTKLSFSLYDFSGRLVAKFPGKNSNALDYRLFNENTNEELTINQTLQPGDYQFVLIPDNSVFATGTYYLIIESNTNIYKINILHRK